MKNQQKGLDDIKEKKCCHVYFIIEGPMKYVDTHKISNIPFKNLHAKLRHNLLRGYPFIQTKDPQDTSNVIVKFARDFMKLYATDEIQFRDDLSEEDKKKIFEYNKMIKDIYEKEPVASVETNTTEEIDNAIDDIQDLCDVDVDIDMESLLNIRIIKGSNEDINMPSELGTRRQQSNSDIVEAMWESIPGVSNKTAPILISRYPIHKIICAEADEIADLKQEISELKYNSGIKVGLKKAAKILELAYSGDNEARKEKNRQASIKILTCIPGITSQTAELIIDNYPLRDICSGQVENNNIAELKKKNGRRIGEKAAEKIIDILCLN